MRDGLLIIADCAAAEQRKEQPGADAVSGFFLLNRV
jgi:hypothetical protein